MGTEKREKVVKIRCTADEYAELKARSTKARLAEWMREHCLDAPSQSRKLQTIDPNLLRQLAGMGNNLNQIARAVNSQHWKPLERVHVIAALMSIEREITALKTENSAESKIIKNDNQGRPL